MMNRDERQNELADEAIGAEKETMIICSTMNITKGDAEILGCIAEKLYREEGGRWVVNIFYGFIVRPGLLDVPAMRMRNEGLSENTIRLLTEGLEIMGYELILFDCDGAALPGWPCFDW